MRQKTSSANFASRTLLELERLLREGGVRPKAAMARALSRSQSQTCVAGTPYYDIGHETLR